MEDIKITYDPFFNEVVYSLIIRGADIKVVEEVFQLAQDDCY